MDDFLLTLGEEPLPWEWRFGQEVPGGWKTPDSWRGRWAAVGLQSMGAPGCGRGSLWKQKGFQSNYSKLQKLTRYQPGQPVFILKEKGNVFLLPSGDSSRQDFTINVIDAKQKLVLWPLNPLGP